MSPRTLTPMLLVGLILTAPAPVLARHVTATYEVEGTAEVDGTEFGFAACLRFNTPVVGNLQFQLLPPMEPVTWNLTWRHQELDTKLNRFQAVSSDLFPYALMLFGGFKGTPHGPVPGLVGGQGVFNLNELSNETGDVTFEFQGVVTKSCAPAPD